jgi:hypothetical protein
MSAILESIGKKKSVRSILLQKEESKYNTSCKPIQLPTSVFTIRSHLPFASLISFSKDILLR